MTNVKVLLAALAVILALPVLVILGIALGPAALVMLFNAGLALIVLLADLAISRNRGWRARVGVVVPAPPGIARPQR